MNTINTKKIRGTIYRTDTVTAFENRFFRRVCIPAERLSSSLCQSVHTHITTRKQLNGFLWHLVWRLCRLWLVHTTNRLSCGTVLLEVRLTGICSSSTHLVRGLPHCVLLGGIYPVKKSNEVRFITMVQPNFYLSFLS